MNPFLEDPVAQPLVQHSRASWRARSKHVREPRHSKKNRTAMIAAGLAIVLPAQALDVNTASVTQLESLRGIGPRTAKMIVQERSRAGAFVSMEDLSDRVRGLGMRRVRALRQAGLDVHSDRAGTGAQQETAALLPEMPEKPSSAKRRPPSHSQSFVAKPEVISPQPF